MKDLKKIQTIKFTRKLSILSTMAGPGRLPVPKLVIVLKFGTNKRGEDYRSVNQVNTANVVVEKAAKEFQDGLMTVEEMVAVIQSQGYKTKTNKATYVLTVSEFFPSKHPKAGLPTGFINAISAKIKIHTIRGNYELWKKRVDKINAGKAILSLRYWTGKPYNSKQKEVFVFEKMGIEKLHLGLNNDIDNKSIIRTIAHYDGLSVADFKAWFKGKDFTQPKAILHFTDFRYNSSQRDQLLQSVN